MKKAINASKKAVTLLLILIVLATMTNLGCTKENEQDKLVEAGRKFQEKIEKKKEGLLLELAEKAGNKDEVLKQIEDRKKSEMKSRKKAEKEIRKILGKGGTIIEDKYIEELFTPEFPINSMNIVEKDSVRYIIVNGKKRMSTKLRTQYVFGTLLSRGVSVHRQMSAHSGTIYGFMITIVRKTETPGVIEYSENIVPQPEKALRKNEESRESLRFKGKNIIIEIIPEFGHKFKRKTIYPEKEIQGPELKEFSEMPETITRYPGSKLVKVYGKKHMTLIYLTRDPIEEVIDFFIDKKKQYYMDNPHMKTSSLYREGKEEYYFLMSNIQTTHRFLGIRDAGTGVNDVGLIDLKRNKSVDIEIRFIIGMRT